LASICSKLKGCTTTASSIKAVIHFLNAHHITLIPFTVDHLGSLALSPLTSSSHPMTPTSNYHPPTPSMAYNYHPPINTNSPPCCHYIIPPPCITHNLQMEQSPPNHPFW
jgi:hypothetical protein